MNLFYQPDIDPNNTCLDTEESRHAIKVLRKKAGDLITIIDGNGTFIEAEIVDPNPKKCSVKILTTTKEETKDHYIHIALAPTKSIDRTEWFIEKAVEIGIDEISLILTKNSERTVVKTDRLFKKAVSAMKQSLKASLPQINEVVKYSAFIDNVKDDEKYIAYVDFSNPEQLFKVARPKSNYCILIGPEGDFTETELNQAIDSGFKKVGLGKSRLRTETAAMVACHILNLINE